MGKKKTWIGIGSWTYPYHCGLGEKISEDLKYEPLMTPYDLIHVAADYDLHCVQICDNLPLDAYSEEELVHISEYAKNRNVNIETGMRGAKPENINRMIEVSTTLGAKLLRCVIDDIGFEPTVEEIVKIFRSFLPELKKRDIVLAIENHDRLLSAEFAQILRLLDDPHYGIVLDTTNSLSKEEPLETVLENLAKYTVCLHLKDYTIRRTPGGVGLEIIGTPVGAGRQRVGEILESVRVRAQQDFSTIIEFWMPPDKDISLLIEQENRWAEESVSYLKTLI